MNLPWGHEIGDEWTDIESEYEEEPIQMNSPDYYKKLEEKWHWTEADKYSFATPNYYNHKGYPGRIKISQWYKEYLKEQLCRLNCSKFM